MVSCRTFCRRSRWHRISISRWGFSSKTGLYFGGSANLTVKFATDVRIGPVTFEAIAIAVKTANGNVQLTLGADIASKLGPLDIIVENVGAAVAFSLSPDCDGNLGPLRQVLGSTRPPVPPCLSMPRD